MSHVQSQERGHRDAPLATHPLRTSIHQHSVVTSIGLHLIPGAVMTLFFVLVTPLLVRSGLPPVWGLLLGALVVIIPFELGVMLYTGQQHTGKLSLQGSVVYREPLTFRQYLWLIPLVLFASLLLPGLVVLLEPLLRTTFFGWLPDWFSAGPPQIAAYSPVIQVVTVILWLVVLVIAGPIVEELYFRGYLLPRIAYLNSFAPLINALLFGLYHVWQPYAFLTLTLTALPMAYAVWSKRNVYLSISAHCTTNLIMFIVLFAGVVGR